MSLFSKNVPSDAKGYHVSEQMREYNLEKYLNTLPSNAKIIQIIVVGNMCSVVYQI